MCCVNENSYKDGYRRRIITTDFNVFDPTEKIFERDDLTFFHNIKAYHKHIELCYYRIYSFKKEESYEQQDNLYITIGKI